MRCYTLYTVKKSSGFSLIEIVIVIAIITIVTTLAFQSFGNGTAQESLNKGAATIVAELGRARSLTLSSKDALQYGVHIDQNSIVLFSGDTYFASEQTNASVTLDATVAVTATSLTGGGSDIVFQRLTGITAQYGTITLTSTSDASKTRTITIYQSGLAEL